MKNSQQQSEMSFMEHLEVLRWHLVRSVIAILVFMIAAFSFKSIVFDYIILAPTHNDFPTYKWFCDFSNFIGKGDSLCFSELKFDLININLSGQFTTHLLVSFVAGIILAFPYVLFEIWRFVKPGLHETEIRYARALIFSGSLLFFFGILFGYFLIAPLSIQFLGNYTISDAVANQISLNSYISTLTTIVLATGLVFQLPLLVYFLAKFGIVSSQMMRLYRKHAFVLSLVLAAILTPPDVSSQILMAIPLVVLYELSIWVAKAVEKKEKAQEIKRI
jgi:sec-independent protein translocase protein TatC